MSDHTDRIARRMGAEFVPMTDNAQAEMVGLIAKLRRRRKVYNGRGTFREEIVNPDGPEVADALERMAGEVAALREALGAFLAEADAGHVSVETDRQARQALATSVVRGRGMRPMTPEASTQDRRARIKLVELAIRNHMNKHGPICTAKLAEAALDAATCEQVDR